MNTDESTNTDKNKIRAVRLEQIIEIASLLQQQDDLKEVIRVVTQKAKILLSADIALIMMVNPRTRQTIKTMYREGDDANNDYKFLHTLLSGWVIKNNLPYYTKNIQEENKFRKEIFEEIKPISALCLPLRSENLIIGTMLLINEQTSRTFTKDDVIFASQLASIASPFMHNVQKIQEYFVSPVPERALISKYETVGLLGRSQKFIELLQAIESAARSDVRVLIDGKSGTGKELVAKGIHQMSNRSHEEFVALDCGTIPEHLIESELFGHAKGSFTGATAARRGLFEVADKGTLFLDEILNLPMDLQSRLLRVLQEGEVRPVGSNEVRKINVRVIAASSIPIRTLVNQDKFREDLYYRLHVYPITVPTLNERQEDIPLLASHFLSKFATRQNKKVQEFHPEVMEYMTNRHWDGNIRQLENFVERLVALVPAEITIIHKDIMPEDLKQEFSNFQSVAFKSDSSLSLDAQVNQFEKEVIRQALTDADWNQSEAARQLHISERSIRYKIKKLDIERPGQ